MDYLDLDLHISAGAEGTYSLDVTSPAGEASEILRLRPGDSELRTDLENARSTAAPQRNLVPRKGKASAGEVVEKLGRELFEALMQDREIYACYRRSLDRAQEDEKGLRIRLWIRAPDLAVLPWEYLYDPQVDDHLCLYERTPVVRYLELARAPETLTLKPPIRILGMVGACQGLDADRERRQMEIAVEPKTKSGDLELSWVEGHGWKHLQEALRRGPWHVFHFVGHGGFDEETGEGLVLLESDGEGREPSAHRLKAGDLASLLTGHGTLRMVFLNSCEGARASATDLYSSTGSILVRRGIPAVVSMQSEITDEAAFELSRAFYDALAEELPVEAALAQARQAIRMTLEATVEWGTPVLHMHSRDGHLFHVDQAIFPEPAPSPPMEPQPRQPVKPEASSPAAGSERDLQILLSRVREYWIAGVLERSIHRFARLELGMELLEGAVESPWGSLLETPGAGREELPHGKTLGQVFEDVGGSLLVLGEPGSGKTTTLLELAQDLLRGAEDDPTSPVPVVFPLSSWAGEGRSLGDWMVDELAKKYMVPKKVSRAWPGGGRILPLLDGLDEVEGGQRPRCVEAINLFTRENPVRVVVCCRLREYRELPVRLALNGAIRLQPLSRQQVFDYLGAFGDRLAALGALLRRDSGLLIDARSPLMLSLMIEAYQGLPVEALATEGRPSVAARRQRLMEAYVEARFHRARTGLYHARP